MMGNESLKLKWLQTSHLSPRLWELGSRVRFIWVLSRWSHKADIKLRLWSSQGNWRKIHSCGCWQHSFSRWLVKESCLIFFSAGPFSSAAYNGWLSYTTCEQNTEHERVIGKPSEMETFLWKSQLGSDIPSPLSKQIIISSTQWRTGDEMGGGHWTLFEAITGLAVPLSSPTLSQNIWVSHT